MSLNVLVTGANRGIGLEFARAYRAEGARVAMGDINIDAARQAAESLGDGAIAVRLDVTDQASIDACVAEVEQAFGGIDILVNNVGGAIRMRPFDAFEPAQIDAEIRRSLMPTLYGCHAVLPYLLARGGGTIVNVSSNATRGIHRVPYSAAKGGINAVTQSLAMEFATRNIRVVATAPGGTSAPARRVPRNADGDSSQEQAWMAQAVEQVQNG